MKQLIKIKSIKGYNSFSELYGLGKKFYEGDIAALICFRPCSEYSRREESTNCIYAGYTIGKKRAKKAVVRNRVKRLLRVSLRNSTDLLTNENGEAPIEFIILNLMKAPRHPGLIRLEDIEPSVRKILSRAMNYIEKNQGSK